MAGAAFFDLDRTLLAGASGPVFSDAMRDRRAHHPRRSRASGCCTACSTRIGETLPSMVLARQAAALAKGRSRAAMQAAGEAAAGDAGGDGAAVRRQRFAEHRAAGRPLVLATTTPYDLVKPLADRLGFDDVIATRYGVDADGTYDGTIVGPFVWAAGKLRRRARRGPTATASTSAESYAYSDSVLRHPAAVGGRPPGRGQPRPAHGRDGHRCGAGRSSTSTCRRACVKIPIARRRAAEGGAAVRSHRAGARTPGSTSPAIEHIPADGPGDHRRQPPQLLRPDGDGAASSPAAAAPCASSARRRCSTCRSSASWRGRWAASASTGRRGSDEPLQAAVDGARGRRAGGDHAAGHDPAGPGVLRSRAEGPLGRGAPGAADQAPGDPGRPVGHRAGVAARRAGCRTCSTSPTRRWSRSGSGRRWS